MRRQLGLNQRVQSTADFKSAALDHSAISTVPVWEVKFSLGGTKPPRCADAASPAPVCTRGALAVPPRVSNVTGLWLRAVFKRVGFVGVAKLAWVSQRLAEQTGGNSPRAPPSRSPLLPPSRSQLWAAAAYFAHGSRVANESSRCQRWPPHPLTPGARARRSPASAARPPPPCPRPSPPGRR